MIRLNGKKGYGIVALALIVLMVLLSLCVQPAEKVDLNRTLPAQTPTSISQPTVRTPAQTPTGTSQPTIRITESPPISQPPIDTTVGGNVAASTMPRRIRAYFSSAYPNTNGLSYSLDFNVIDSGWLYKNVYSALPLEAYAHFSSPPVKKTFIFWNDIAYAMPEQFNRFAQDSHLSVTTPADAGNIADFYVKVSEPCGAMGHSPAIVLNSSTDIPSTKNPISQELTRTIQSPNISIAGDEFRVNVYTWAPVGGVVRQWDLKVTRMGQVTATSHVVGESIGDALPGAYCSPASVHAGS